MILIFGLYFSGKIIRVYLDLPPRKRGYFLGENFPKKFLFPLLLNDNRFNFFYEE
jgi:hypothetical protein